MIKERIFGIANYAVAKLWGRELVLFPSGGKGVVFDTSRSKALLPLEYTYRASADSDVSYKFRLPGSDCTYDLYTVAYEKGRPIKDQLYLSLTLPIVNTGDKLRVNVKRQETWLNERAIQPVTNGTVQTRKLIAELQTTSGRNRLARSCYHYLPFDHKPISKDYYFGDDYSDYVECADPRDILRRVQKHCSTGRLLDIGCALGIYTKNFLDAGFDSYGIDISEFAVAEAAKSVGSNRVRQCNLDDADIPFATTFDIFLMWDVLEHSANPQRMLTQVSAKANAGAWLFLHTSNSESLMHRLLGADWEGYSDYSHYGVDQVSTQTLKGWLKELGWEIVTWECGNIWVSGVDPTLLRMQEAFRKIPELALLLSERELGDLIFVVACRNSPPQRESAV